jgi:hypothetical protein
MVAARTKFNSRNLMELAIEVINGILVQSVLCFFGL